MDAKITKKRLGLLLSYDWIKIVGICVAAVLVWALLFTTMATRPTNGQKFDMFLYPGVRLNNKIDTETVHTRDENDMLSYDILDFSSTALSTDTMDTIMQTRFAASEGDVLFAADEAPTTDDGGKITAYNGLDDFVNRYSGYAVWLGADGKPFDSPTGGGQKSNYFTDCENYLKKFYNVKYKIVDGKEVIDWANSTLDEQKVRANFDNRMQGDKRYKTEAQREAGRLKEIERIQNLCRAFVNVTKWVAVDENGEPVDANSPISIRTTELEVDLDDDGAAENIEWQFAFDLSNITNLTDFVYYYDEEASAGTRENLCMVVLNTGSYGDEDLRYEPFLLLDYLVKTYAPEKYETQ